MNENNSTTTNGSAEQVLLLRECRTAIADLLEKKPELSAMVCGSTTLGNLKAHLGAYRSNSTNTG